VHPASSTKQGRAANPGQAPGSANQPMPMNIDDPNRYADSTADSADTCRCCFRCVMYWWFWALLLILAVGGVTLPVLGYFDLLSETECEDKLTASTVPVNADAATQGQLNALFVVDCAADDFDAQFASADALLSQLSSVDVSYGVLQYCTCRMACYSTAQANTAETSQP